MRSAALRLRGRDGPLHAEVTWPEGEPEALVVLLAGAADERPRAVRLRVECATDHDERAVVEWAEHHAHELGVPPGCVIVVR